ncbi:hypothetical protein Daus18300_011962 [Diaporthe australafricana]|uniref:2EXR domain-containing protein n=1 Tax=Diaporthe australafricana TaxID=127596 RepID=A0ABR3W4C4_9PEZI
MSHIFNHPPGSEFTWFGFLPCELRLLVWKAAMKPQLVPVKLKRDGKRDSRHPVEIRGISALLAVNKEARHIALRHYSSRFTLKITFVQYVWIQGTVQEAPPFHLARIIMSPDDTLGFLCWQIAVPGGEQAIIKVESANQSSPWNCHKTEGLPQPAVEKVATLGYDLEFNHHIVKNLNSTASWDLDSILHVKSGRIRRLDFPPISWSDRSGRVHSRQHISMLSDVYTGSLEDWLRDQRFMNTNLLGLFTYEKPEEKIDILTIKLNQEPKEAEEFWSSV